MALLACKIYLFFKLTWQPSTKSRYKEHLTQKTYQSNCMEDIMNQMYIYHTVILPVWTTQKRALSSMPSSIARNSSAPNAKRVFQIHQGILEGCTNRAQPFQPSLKNCQNGTFLTLHGNRKFFEPNVFFWCTVKVPFSDFFLKSVPSFVHVLF